MTGFSLYVSANYNNSRFRAPLLTTPVTTPTPQLLINLGFGTIATILVSWTIAALKGMFTTSVDWLGSGITQNYPLANNTVISHTYTTGTGAGASIGISDDSLFYSVHSNQSNCITDVGDLTAWIIDLDLSGEKLNSTQVNSVLQTMFTFGYSFGTIDVSGQTPAAPPTGTGITAKNNLIYRGWKVTTD
jgi:hypothetical protein